MTTKNLGHYTLGRAPLVILGLLGALPFACHSAQPEPAARPAQSALSAPTLGAAASFLVLGGSTVTNTGATTIHGDIGVAPGLAITGFPPGLVLGGTVHAGDVTALQARNDLTAAYLVLAGEPCGFDLTGKDLGGLTLTQGVYCFSSEAQLTGSLVLDAQGDASAVFVFQVGSKLTTASNASVTIINGGQECRAFWQIGSSVTLGTDTVFAGSLLALTSIVLETGATVTGRLLARNGAVTMDANHVFPGICAGTGSDAGVDGSVAGSGGGVAGSGGSAGSGGAAGTGGSDGGDAGESLCCGTLCGASCTDLGADVANCGSCGHGCALDEFCAAGVCVLCCPVCGGKCVDLAADPTNCGSCGNACPASALCTGGACVPCATVCGGKCVDLVADPANCGSCGKSCLAGETCTAGSCVPCANVCGGVCVDVESNHLNCGACGNACTPGAACKGGLCVCQ